MTGIAAGSSPLARGKCAAVAWLEDSAGFIPTRAGKMRCINSQRCRVKVHPHSRGEKNSAACLDKLYMGSSPLARGKSVVINGCGVLFRFIPTRAGKMGRSRSGCVTAAVHPHSRGENAAGLLGAGTRVGSSPLARGKSCGRSRHQIGVGFIPTRAGKISSAIWICGSKPVHPHSRGENYSRR